MVLHPCKYRLEELKRRIEFEESMGYIVISYIQTFFVKC
jgi:hypothetical protein